MAGPDSDWSEQAAALAEEVRALAAAFEAEGVPEDPLSATEGYRQRVQALVEAIRSGTSGPVDDATREALQTLGQAHAALREICERDLTALAERRGELRQASRALRGYAAATGPTESRYFNDQG